METPATQPGFLAAQGYLELGMFEESLGELDGLPVELREHFETRVLRLQALLKSERWEDALSLANVLWDGTGKTAGMRLHTAFCLHELKRTEEARDLLLSVGELLGVEPVYHYNLACYFAVLGDLEQARGRLKIALELEPELRKTAAADEDLKGLGF